MPGTPRGLIREFRNISARWEVQKHSRSERHVRSIWLFACLSITSNNNNNNHHNNVPRARGKSKDARCRGRSSLPPSNVLCRSPEPPPCLREAPEHLHGCHRCAQKQHSSCCQTSRRSRPKPGKLERDSDDKNAISVTLRLQHLALSSSEHKHQQQHHQQQHP